MRRDIVRTWGNRTGRFLLAGVLALAMVPAVALSAFAVGVDEQGDNPLNLKLANQKWTNSLGEEYTIWDDGYWSYRDDATGTYVWSTVVQGDNSHYGHYDVDITFTVEDGVLTAVDMTSQGNTFGGIWGNINKTSVVSGYLPTGVLNTTEVTSADDITLVALSLGGAIADYDTQGNGGYSIKEMTIYQADEQGNVEEYARDEDGNIIYDEVYDPDDGDWDLVPRANGVTLETSGTSSDEEVATYDPDTQTIAVSDDSYNLVKTDYVIGDFFTFEQFTALDDNAAKYDVEQTDYAAEPTGIALKNRDSYTLSVYAIMMQHELALYMNNGTLSADIDTVSSATKSSWAIQEATYAALGYYYPVTNKVEYDPNIAPVLSDEYPDPIFTDVSAALKMTFDGDIVVRDETSAFENENGSYTVNVEDYNEALAIGSIALYNIDGELSGDQLFSLGLNNDSTMYKANNGEDVSSTGYLESWVTNNSGSHGVKGALTSDEVSGGATWEDETNTLIVNNPEATHVVVGYSVAKANNGSYGQVCVAYSLEDLLAAGEIEDLIDAMDVTSVDSILETYAAYESLSKNAQLTIAPDMSSKLLDAYDALTTVSVNEYGGAGRYDTMQQIVEGAFTVDNTDAVVVASGSVYADALTAASLAGALNAPIVLTDPSSASEQAIDLIATLKPTSVYVVGGENTVSNDVAQTLAQGLEYERVSGATRVETAEQVAVKTAELSDEASDTVVIACSTTFADALSASPYAYAAVSPILLAGNDKVLSDQTLDVIAEGGYTDYLIIGGENSISGEVEGQLEAAGLTGDRLAGDSRYETSCEFADFAVNAGVLTFDGLGIATGSNFPDALAGGAYCGSTGSVLLLAADSSTAAADLIAPHAATITSLNFFGGTSSISENLRANIIAAATAQK